MLAKSLSPEIKKRCAGGGFWETQYMRSTRRDLSALFFPPAPIYVKMNVNYMDYNVLKCHWSETYDTDNNISPAHPLKRHA